MIFFLMSVSHFVVLGGGRNAFNSVRHINNTFCLILLSFRLKIPVRYDDYSGHRGLSCLHPDSSTAPNSDCDCLSRSVTFLASFYCPLLRNFRLRCWSKNELVIVAIQSWKLFHWGWHSNLSIMYSAKQRRTLIDRKRAKWGLLTFPCRS